jgi:hypothetical protein
MTFDGRHDPKLIPIEPPRELRPDERVALDFLLSHEFKGSAELRRQADIVKVGSRCSCCADIWFSIDRDLVAPAKTRHAVPVTANKTDADGLFLEVFVYTQDGYLAALEMWAGDGKPRYVFPQLKGFDVFMVDPIDDGSK